MPTLNDPFRKGKNEEMSKSENGRTIGYARVSLSGMNEARQTDRLSAVCDEVYVEKVSAAAKSRPVFERVIKNLKPSDTLIVLDLDLDLLAELVQDGHFTDEDYAKFASIEDPDERRKAIAQAFQDKIDAGEIDPQDYKDHPFALEWLELHEEARQEISLKSDKILDGQENVADASTSVQNEVKGELKSQDQMADAQQASIEADNSIELSSKGDLSLNASGGLSGMSL